MSLSLLVLTPLYGELVFFLLLSFKCLVLFCKVDNPSGFGNVRCNVCLIRVVVSSMPTHGKSGKCLGKMEHQPSSCLVCFCWTWSRPTRVNTSIIQGALKWKSYKCSWSLWNTDALNANHHTGRWDLELLKEECADWIDPKSCCIAA